MQPDTDHVVPLQVFPHALLVHRRILLWQVCLHQRKCAIFGGYQQTCEQICRFRAKGNASHWPPRGVASHLNSGDGPSKWPLADLLEGPFRTLDICPLLHGKVAGLACSVCHLLAQLAGCQLHLLTARRLSCRLQVQKSLLAEFQLELALSKLLRACMTEHTLCRIGLLPMSRKHSRLYSSAHLQCVLH